MMGDSELVGRVLLLNDKNAYSDLVRKYQVAVRSYLFRLVRKRELANDLAQEVFLLGYRRLNQLQDATKFRNWIYSIAHTQFLQWHRSNKEFELYNESDEQVAVPSVFAKVELQSLFKHLRAEECSVLILCLGQEFSHAEAAETLGIPIGTVKSLISRAREKVGGLYENQ